MKQHLGATLVIAVVVSSASGQTAQEVLAKAFRALGGRQNLENVRTITGTGSLEALGGFPGTYQLWEKAPNKRKTAWDIHYIEREQAFDGEEGWERNGSVRELVERDLIRARHEAIFNPLLRFARQNTPAEMEGSVEIPVHELPVDPTTLTEEYPESKTSAPQSARRVYVVKFTPAAEEPTRFYFDTDSYLPLRESFTELYEEGPTVVKINYSDYRKVGDILLPFVINTVVPDLPLLIKMREYKVNLPLDDSIFANPLASRASERHEVTLATIPRHVYKENDGMWDTGWERFWGIPFSPSESWYFNLVVNEKNGRYLEPVSASMEFYSGSTEVKAVTYSSDELKSSMKFPVTRFAPQPEIFDFRYFGSELVQPAIDRLVYRIDLKTSHGETLHASEDIPLASYTQKSKLIFPIRGNFIVANGHEFYETGHSYEWSQHYGYDIVALGPNFEVKRGPGSKNEDFVGYAHTEVIAPADGMIVYARNNDVPDTLTKRGFLATLPDPKTAIGGNLVVIDHGNGEFSLFAHMHQGSVRIKVGDRVKQAQVIGLMGAAGSPGIPHLHYQLQAGPGVFDSDGLPSQFENIETSGWGFPGRRIRTPKRGVYMTAK